MHIDGKTVQFGSGDLLIFDKNSPQNYKSNPNNPIKKIWASFTGDYLGALFESYRIHTGVYHIDLKQEFLSLYRIAKINALPQSKYFELAELLHNIILKIAQLRFQEMQTPIYSIKNAILSSVYNKKTLDEIATELFTSKSNLIRIFKKQTGETPYQFLLNERFRIAKQLLSTTSIQIKNISDLLCFTDEHYFSFLFKQKTGVSPSQYRNQFQSH